MERTQSPVAESWTRRAHHYLREWRWGPLLGKAVAGLGAMAALSFVGAGGLDAAGVDPTALAPTERDVAARERSAPSDAEGLRAPDPAGLTAAATAPRAALEAGASTAASAVPRASVDCDRGPRGTMEDGRVILNAATTAELETLPGIGPARARAIVELRERLGRFRRVEELLRVKGIGPRSLSRLRPLVVLDPPDPEPTLLERPPVGATST
jgi:competence protein ComEA